MKYFPIESAFLLMINFFMLVCVHVGVERHLGVIPLLVRGLHLRQLEEDSLRGTAASLRG